ncbi:MAG: hemolysin family protein [Calditrichota bacterium]
MYEPIIIIISLAMSFFFAGTETAFVSVNKVRVEVWRRSGARFAGILYDFVQKPEQFLYTTLIGNNIFNVAFATYSTIYFNRFIRPEFTWVLVVSLTLIIGELIPKTVFRSLADWVVQKIAWPLRMFYHAFRPLIFLVSRFSEFLLFLFGYRRDALERFFSEQDIEVLINESPERVKGIDAEEEIFVSGVLSLRELRVREAMVPRTEMVAVADTISLDDLRMVFVRNGFTKIPVFQGTVDNFIGVVFAKDLLLGASSLESILRPVSFIPDSKRCSELLSEFRSQNNSLAVVIDEYGGTAGLITTEDLVEVLFGEIEDEFDAEEHWFRKIDDFTYSIDARVELEKPAEQFGLTFPEGEYETLAGYMIHRLERIPQVGDKILLNQFLFTVSEGSRRKVDRILLKIDAD